MIALTNLVPRPPMAKGKVKRKGDLTFQCKTE